MIDEDLWNITNLWTDSYLCLYVLTEEYNNSKYFIAEFF